MVYLLLLELNVTNGVIVVYLHSDSENCIWGQLLQFKHSTDSDRAGGTAV